MGFALLGEVLLRRTDFERAVPVLQHAQNLDPTSPSILAMLKRARAGQGLDPPPPVPTPVPPRGETSMGIPQAPPRSRGQASVPPPPQPQQPPQSSMHVPTAPPQMATLAINVNAPQAPQSMPPGGMRIPFDEPAPPPARDRGPRSTAPPPLSIEGVRPRVISGAKPQNAAAASLRQSAAVGESYLNDLLTGGLLDVAGVRVPETDYDLRPDRRWGRSTRRAFVFLFVILVLSIGGGGSWYWWSQKKQAEQIARLQKEIGSSLVLADYDGFRAAAAKLKSALELDKSNPYSYALVVESTGLEALLYGSPPDAADAALAQIGTAPPTGDQQGAREVIVGRAALELSRLHTREKPVAQSKLAEITKSLDGYLAKHEDDRWVRWLKGRAQIAAGDRKDGRATIARAADGDDGLVIAI
ncbi:MAG: hypothetical protein NT062_22900, partial [Proteobacteria bacterium]|nr:hypothetical protein [Pseudomonadota bacterium]